MRISDWSSDVCSSDLLALAARFLAAEIIRRHAQHHEAPVAIGVPDLLQVGVLRGEAALRGGIDQQHGLAAELRHRQRFAVNAGEAEVMGGHARSEEHTSELQSLMRISYAVFCLKKKKTTRR